MRCFFKALWVMLSKSISTTTCQYYGVCGNTMHTYSFNLKEMQTKYWKGSL